MTTQEIRQEALDRMNGSHPMSFADAVKVAEGYLEELGLVGYLSIEVEYNRYTVSRDSLIWKGYFSLGTNLQHVRLEAPTAERMLAGFRLELLKLSDPQPVDLASVGVPALTSEQGA